MNYIKRLDVWLPIIIFVMAFALRIYHLDQNLFFGWEQGRDALIVNDIIDGRKFTLIGPKTDIEGIFHGPLYYYLLAIPYFLGKGNPLWAAYFIAFINALGASVIYFIGKGELKLITRIAASLIFVFSFQGNVFSRWLSNPTLSLPLTIFFIYNLKRQFNRNNFLLALFFWACIFHFELAAALFLLPVLIYYLLKNLKKFNLFLIVQGTIVLSFMFSPYLIFNIRHGNILIAGLVNFLKIHKEANFNLLKFASDLSVVIQRELTLSLSPAFPQVAKFIFVLGFICLILTRKKFIAQIVFFWLFFPLLIMVFVKTIPMSQVLTFLVGAFCLLAALIIEKASQLKLRILAIGIIIFIIFSNFVYFRERVDKSENFFFRSYQYTFLGDQRRILDFVYDKASGREFSYNYYSFPYWLPQGWEYLFSWYGKNKFGYLPSEKKTEEFFVIIEPDEVTPNYKQDWYEKLNKESTLIESFSSDNLQAEQRTIF